MHSLGIFANCKFPPLVCRYPIEFCDRLGTPSLLMLLALVAFAALGSISRPPPGQLLPAPCSSCSAVAPVSAPQKVDPARARLSQSSRLRQGGHLPQAWKPMPVSPMEWEQQMAGLLAFLRAPHRRFSSIVSRRSGRWTGCSGSFDVRVCSLIVWTGVTMRGGHLLD